MVLLKEYWGVKNGGNKAEGQHGLLKNVAESVDESLINNNEITDCHVRRTLYTTQASCVSLFYKINKEWEKRIDLDR